jgi:amino acid adenylation domain-containing protein
MLMLTPYQRAELTAQLRRDRITAAADRIPCRDPAMVRIPASFGQEQLWFIDRYAPGQATYNLPCVISMRGPLDPAALSRALGRLIERHETLRTRLMPGADGRPVQVIDEPAKPDLVPIELPRAELRDYIHDTAMQPFDLATGPLLRTDLVRVTENEHLLVAVLHHTIFDGWSNGVFLRDLAALYANEAAGLPSGLTDLDIQFADYAVWERDRLSGNALAELQDYWRRTMTGFATIQFPTDRPHPVVEDFAGGLAERMTDAALLAGLRAVSNREGSTVFATFMAGVLTLLHRYTAQTDLVIGTVSANRSRGALTPLIGFLVNTLPIRADLSGDPPFTEVMARVKQATVGAFAHQDLPFSKIVDTLKVARDARRAPIFQILLTYVEREDVAVPAAGVDFTASDLIAGLPAAKFDLTFAAEARSDGLWIECSYKTALFDPGTIERLLAHLETLLRGVVAKPAARLSELPLLTEAELHAEMTTWNDTAGPVPEGCAHQRFEAQAAATPEGVAARFEDQQLTYGELNRHADQIAARLREQGVGRESLVGVRMRTSLARLAVFLGIWKAGGGYVPLDPSLPAERLEFMIADTGMNVVVDDQPGEPAGDPAGTVMVTAPSTALEAGQRRNHHDHREGGGGGAAAAESGPEDVAYVIYTSGSTGQPKGVVIEHRSLVNLAAAMAARWDIGPGSNVLQFASFTFDVSVMDMFTPLLAGATVILAEPDTLHSPPRLAALLRRERITFAGLPPAVLNLLPDGDYPHLRTLMTAGEELPASLARRWTKPGLRLVNGYGPTETTIIATQAEITPDTPMPPPIGYPVHPNYRAYVLDTHLNPVPIGVTGELHIGGSGVARGYLNRPQLTAQRFITHPSGQRLYKTGDLVKRRPDGSLVYLGRIDNQIKINGIRIEPGEIETTLTTHPAITQAVVHPVNGELVAWIRTTSPVSETDIRTHLARTLPAAMIPAHVIPIDTFPLNSSGKVDKKALPAPTRRQVTGRDAPATPTEEMLTDLYATLLGTQRPGATDGFFELGGNSLNAMRLVDLIGRKTGIDIAVTQVFLHPTPRSLGEFIDSGAPRQAGPVVRLTAATTAPPMFLLHPIGGTVTAYPALSQELAAAFTVYGVESPGLNGGVAGTLTDLVADYTRRLREAQPDGPYRLAGWSMGGVIAFEIARRLERSGAEVGSLVLLDAPFAPGDSWGTTDQAERARRFVEDAAQTTGLDLTSAPTEASAAEQLDWLAARLAVENDLLHRRFDVFVAHSRMLAAYQPAGPPIQAQTLIVSAVGSPNAPAREQWPRLLSGPVRVECVDSDHYAFLRPPLVAEVAAMIRDWDR